MKIGFGAATSGWDRRLRRAGNWALAVTMVGCLASSATAAEPDYMPVTDAYSFYQLCTDPELDGAGRVARLEESGWERVELDGVPFPSGPDWDLNDPVHLAALSRVITSFSVNGTNVDILRSKLDEDIETGSFGSRPFRLGGSNALFSRTGQIVAIDGPSPAEHARRSRSCRYLGPVENGASRLYSDLPGDDFDIGKALRVRLLDFEADFGSVSGGYMAISRGDVLAEILGQPAPDIFYLRVGYRLKE